MQNLNAYIPMDRRLALARGETLPDRCAGAALFADVCEPRHQGGDSGGFRASFCGRRFRHLVDGA